MLALTLLFVPHFVAGVAFGREINPQRVAYFLDNDPAGSSIISLKISVENGALSDPIRTSTGGKGFLGLTASANGSLAAGMIDTLFTQDAVVVSQDYLFTVNAGSNTVSMFFIDKNNPSVPRLINTAPTLGEFPSSVAYSPRLKTACVLNGGSVGGVSCFSTDHAKGLSPLGGLRPIKLNQSNPPVGPPGTASDIVFNPSQTALVATIKGSPTSPGSIYIYPILDCGEVSTTPVLSKPSGLLLDFSVNFLGFDNRAVITDPAYGASIVTIDKQYNVGVDTKIVVQNESAICWSAFSQRFNTIFIMDAGKPNVIMIEPETGAFKGVIELDAEGKGALDTALDRTYLYVLRGGSTISVLDLEGLRGSRKVPVEIQSLDLSALGSRQAWMGMAVYPSSATN